jgi:hypothetical protein
MDLRAQVPLHLVRSLGGVARRADDFELDPGVVTIAGDAGGSMDDWLQSLMHEKPIDLVGSGADLVAEARAKQ